MDSHKIGLIIGSFKPYTAGHHFLIETAAAENSMVLLFVSQKSRKRKGEIEISGEKMKKVWNDYIKNIIPKNVFISFVDNPAVSLHNYLVQVDKGKLNSFTLYSDEADKKRYRYEDKEIKKNFPNLFNQHNLKIKVFSREKNVNISATKMRQTLMNKDIEMFTTMLPNPLVVNAKQIFDYLS